MGKTWQELGKRGRKRYMDAARMLFGERKDDAATTKVCVEHTSAERGRGSDQDSDIFGQDGCAGVHDPESG